MLELEKESNFYQKLGIQLFLGISVINFLIVYKIATKTNIKIKRFREFKY